MCILKMPVLCELSWVAEGVDGLDIPLNKAQRANLLRLLCAIILLNTINLSSVSVGCLEAVSINALSHFMMYTGLIGESLMDAAVRYAIRVMGLRKASIRLAIDDTMEHHSKMCRCIANVYNLFDHALGTYCQAKCIVFAYVVINDHTRFPIGWRVYRQGGKKKWELALELVDKAISFDFMIQVVLFDSWYCVEPFISEIKNRNLIFISELKSNQLAEFSIEGESKRVKIFVSKVFEYCKSLCKNVTLGLGSDNEENAKRTLYTTQTAILYVSALKMKLNVIKSVDVRKDCYKIFVTNAMSWEATKVLSEYSYRWMIEEFFRNAKQYFGLEGASIRSEQGGALKLFLVSFADLLVSIQLWKSVQDGSKKDLQTVSAILATASEENLQHLLRVDNPEIFNKIIDYWLKICRKRQETSRRKRWSLKESIDQESTEIEQNLQEPAEAV